MKKTTFLVEKNVPIKMRDGIITRADIYRPAKTARYPVLLYRFPYNKAHPQVLSPILNPLNAPERGYVVVIQDCRGRFSSDGEFEPFVSESLDGYDSVEWCAEQSWSNGKVGIYGSSYSSVTAWQAVMSAPPHLKAAFIRHGSANVYDGWVYRGGAFELGFNWAWSFNNGSIDTVNRRSPEERAAVKQNIWDYATDASKWLRYLPLDKLPGFGTIAPFYKKWLTHSSYDEYWKAISADEHYDKVRVPVLQLTGWFDAFLGSLEIFENIRKHGALEKARKNQKLIIGPWTHGAYMTPTPTRIGDFDLGPSAMVDGQALAFRWFDHWLKGINTGMMEEPSVRIFTIGKNEWRDEYEWPLKRAKSVSWYLHSNGKANSANGDGTLTLDRPKQELPDGYTYDPADPVPTVGGRTLIRNIDVSEGLQDQRSIEGRNDILVYTSSLLKKDIEVTGPLSLKLWAASSAKDTDFTGKLVDVYPDGYACIVAEGILRARFRESFSAPKLLKPGQINEFNISLYSISYLFKKGHRIRLEVSSSNFPKFDRNLNTGGNNATETQIVVAKQTVFHDIERPSQVILPVIE